jgi:bifunctional non-homologous end joining protein LigD
MKLEKTISHPDKLYWPDDGYTKLDLARFYERIFPRVKPYVAGRPLSLERCPDGMKGQCFYQKEAPKSLPPSTPTKLLHHEKKDVNYVIGGKCETQIALVNLGCIPVHIWQSRAATPQKPDWIVFDMDPANGEFADAANAGLLVKEELDRLELKGFPKTSGSRGLHILVPIKKGPDYETVRTFARDLCARLAAAHPELLTMEQRIENRGNRVYLDVLRNGYGATVVAPFSVRRRPQAPFSMPLSWSAVKPSLEPAKFNLGNYETVLEMPDPWEDFFQIRQSIK